MRFKHGVAGVITALMLATISGAAAAADATATQGSLSSMFCAPEEHVATCSPTDRLRDAFATIAQRSWHPRAAAIGVSGYPDSAGNLHVRFSRADADVAQALVRTLGTDRVVLETGEVSQFEGGRTNDSSPHFGGAAIGPPTCTSGFSVVLADGNRGSVSTAHCYENDDVLLSGQHIFGEVTGKQDFPTFDMVALRNPDPALDVRYTNKIYTDPGSPTTRTVVGKADVVENETDICLSGRVTKAKCSATVHSVFGFYCPTFLGPCTFNLAVMSRPGVVLAQPGDSGGPVYTRSGSTDAIIRGMIVAGDATPSGGPVAGGNVYVHHVTDIESHLKVNVLTTP